MDNRLTEEENREVDRLLGERPAPPVVDVYNEDVVIQRGAMRLERLEDRQERVCRAAALLTKWGEAMYEQTVRQEAERKLKQRITRHRIRAVAILAVAVLAAVFALSRLQLRAYERQGDTFHRQEVIRYGK
jgi:hypothetical protein